MTVRHMLVSTHVPGSTHIPCQGRLSAIVPRKVICAARACVLTSMNLSAVDPAHSCLCGTHGQLRALTNSCLQAPEAYSI